MRRGGHAPQSQLDGTIPLICMRNDEMVGLDHRLAIQEAL